MTAQEIGGAIALAFIPLPLGVILRAIFSKGAQK